MSKQVELERRRWEQENLPVCLLRHTELKFGGMEVAMEVGS